jgi:hypothetical protein
MYRAFNLNFEIDFCNNLSILDNNYDSNDCHLWQEEQTKIKDKLKETLTYYMNYKESLKGKNIIKKWFPTINADVFISHSHNDENLATSLASFLKSHFNIDCFVDSAVWGYVNDLLFDIDREHCLNMDSKSYDYQKRNISTTHVHSMLSASLANMLDNTECLFVLNTPNSISATDEINNTMTTGSPWIFYELSVANVIRRKTKKNHRDKNDLLIKSLSEKAAALEIKYETKVEDIRHIDDKDFFSWVRNTQDYSSLGIQNRSYKTIAYDALDNLYKMYPPNDATTRRMLNERYPR